MPQPSAPSLAFVLLAFNEQDEIAEAIADCRSFAEAHLSAHEIIVVDDGSTDGTGERARAASRGDVRVIRHDRNLGMGASMRDGYLAATMDYVAHLPGDRQVRPEALVPMLPLHGPDTVVCSTYSNAPSGASRAAMSVVFRALTRYVGGMRVNFAGTYLFHRHWLQRVALQCASSDSFLFSFQLLELFRRAEARFEFVKVRTYPRQFGTSREATLGRVGRMFVEIGRARLGP